MTQSTDEEVEARFLERLRGHDERAFNQLVAAYQGRVYRLMFRMLGRRDEAEDMVQEVFVQVFKSIGAFRGEAKLGTWIYRIAVNLCRNRAKYLGRRRAAFQEEFDANVEREAMARSGGVTGGEVAQRPDQVVMGYQAEALLQGCIRELEPDFRDVLILRDVEALSYEDIQAITGLAEGTVKSRLHRARTMVKEKLGLRLGEKLS